MDKKEKTKALELALGQIDKHFGKGAVMKLGDAQDVRVDSISTGKISGAALDVFDVEPPDDLKFLRLPNLMVTPHIGGNSLEAIEAMGTAAIDNLAKFFNK